MTVLFVFRSRLLTGPVGLGVRFLEMRYTASSGIEGSNPFRYREAARA